MPSSYGLVTAGYAERLILAEIARWNDNIKRHTIYTVGSTLQDPWGLRLGNRAAVTGPTPLTATVPYDAAIGAQSSSQLYTWVPLSYPASYVTTTPQIVDTWDPKNLSLAQVVTWGATELRTLIAATPGTFALVGTGLGAMVCSAALTDMQTGTLANRMGDCIAAVMIGNPCREEGVTYPGGSAPGAGIMPRASVGTPGLIRNADTPTWWWEMAHPDDPIAACPIDTAGQAVNIVADALMSTAGGRDLLTQMAKIPGVFKSSSSATWRLVANRLTNRTANTQALAWAEQVFALTPSPHITYSERSMTHPPTDLTGLAPNATPLDAALAYINLRGTTIPPR